MGKRKLDVFVSYRSTDKEAALVLAGKLRKARLKVWIDKERLVVGEFDERLRAAIDSSKSVAALVGPTGMGRWQKREIAYAADNPRSRLIPVLLPGARKRVSLPLALAGLHRIDLTKGVDKDGIRALVAAIKAKPTRADPSGKPAAPPRRKRPKARAAGGTTVIGNNNQVATNGSIVAGNITGSIVTVGKGNVVQTGKNRGW